MNREVLLAIWRGCGLLALTALLVVAGARPAGAAGGGDGCNPGRSSNFSSGIHYFSGITDYSGASTYGGIGGDIVNYSPWVYNSSYEGTRDATTQWVMLADTLPDSWAQVGWLEYSGGGRHTFVEYVNSDYDVNWLNTFAPYPIGDTENYQVLFNINCPNNDCFTFWADGTDT